MRLEHHSQVTPRDFEFIPDFTLESPVTRYDPDTGRVLVGRPTKVFGESFSYAGVTKVGHPWHESKILSILKKDIEEAFKVDIVTCLVGYYPDGYTAIPFHKDVMGDNGVILNMSFGDPRLFRVQWNDTGKIDTYIMQNGDVLLFDGEANKQMLHDVPAVSGKVGPRWSLTFRSTVK